MFQAIYDYIENPSTGFHFNGGLTFIGGLIGGTICLYLVIKKDFKHNLSVYLVAYGIFRFFLEYLRDDHRGALVGSISPSQFWSALMVVAGVFVFFIVRCIYRKAAKDEAVS